MGGTGLGGGNQASGVNFQVPSCSPHWLMAIYHLPFFLFSIIGIFLILFNEILIIVSMWMVESHMRIFLCPDS